MPAFFYFALGALFGVAIERRDLGWLVWIAFFAICAFLLLGRCVAWYLARPASR